MLCYLSLATYFQNHKEMVAILILQLTFTSQSFTHPFMNGVNSPVKRLGRGDGLKFNRVNSVNKFTHLLSSHFQIGCAPLNSP